MLVSEQARVFQVRDLRCSKEPTVLGLSPVRLGNRTYRAWRTTKLTPMGNGGGTPLVESMGQDLSPAWVPETFFSVSPQPALLTTTWGEMKKE